MEMNTDDFVNSSGDVGKADICQTVTDKELYKCNHQYLSLMTW